MRYNHLMTYLLYNYQDSRITSIQKNAEAQKLGYGKVLQKVYTWVYSGMVNPWVRQGALF